MDNLTILTTVIGASAANIGVVVTKDSKISEFRQQWIDALREDVAKFCSSSITLYRSNIAWSLRDTIKGLEVKSSDDLVEESNNLLFRIKLRLDPKNPLANDLVEAMMSLVSLCTCAQEMSTVIDEAAVS